MKKNLLLIPDQFSKLELVNFHKAAFGEKPGAREETTAAHLQPYYFFHTLVSTEHNFPRAHSDFFNLDNVKLTVNVLRSGRTEKNAYPCLFLERSDELLELREKYIRQYNLTDSRERYIPKLIISHTAGQKILVPDDQMWYPSSITFERVVLKDIHDQEYHRQMKLNRNFQGSFMRQFFHG